MRADDVMFGAAQAHHGSTCSAREENKPSRTLVATKGTPGEIHLSPEIRSGLLDRPYHALLV